MNNLCFSFLAARLRKCSGFAMCPSKLGWGQGRRRCSTCGRSSVFYSERLCFSLLVPDAQFPCFPTAAESCADISTELCIMAPALVPEWSFFRAHYGTPEVRISFSQEHHFTFICIEFHLPFWHPLSQHYELLLKLSAVSPYLYYLQ